jgi:hypothetical protein
MDYKWFVFVLIASVIATLGLTLWKALGRAIAWWDDDYGVKTLQRTFIGRLSWFAVPWPLFIGVTVLGLPYILAVVFWHF